MKKYKSLLLSYWMTALEYRSNLVSTFILEALGIGSVIILWLSVYGVRTDIAGYDVSDTVSYYILVPIIGFFTSVNLSDKLSEEIRRGLFSNHLLRPYKFWIVSFTEVLAGKLSFLLLTSPLILGVVLYMISKDIVISNLISLILVIVTLIFSFLMHFILDFSIALSAFWLDDIWAFKHIKNIFFSVLGGISFPLVFATGTLRSIVEFLPFKYFYYIPVAYLIGERDLSSNFVPDMTQIVIWSLFIVVITASMWHFGLKKYEAYGN